MSFIVQVSETSVYQFSVIYNGNTYAFGPSWDGQWNSLIFTKIFVFFFDSSTSQECFICCGSTKCKFQTEHPGTNLCLPE